MIITSPLIEAMTAYVRALDAYNLTQTLGGSPDATIIDALNQAQIYLEEALNERERKYPPKGRRTLQRASSL